MHIFVHVKNLVKLYQKLAQSHKQVRQRKRQLVTLHHNYQANAIYLVRSPKLCSILNADDERMVVNTCIYYFTAKYSSHTQL